MPSCSAGRRLLVRIASKSIVLHHCCIETCSVAAASCMAFLSQPSTNTTRLYFLSLCLARLGVIGIFVDKRCDVFGDAHVISVSEFNDFVFEVGGNLDGERCGFVGLFRWASVATHRYSSFTSCV